MDAADFSMPSPKRQRTNSPDEDRPTPTKMSTAFVAESPREPINIHKAENETITQQITAMHDQNEILDVLMQHVESEATPSPSIPHETPPEPELHEPILIADGLQPQTEESETTQSHTEAESIIVQTESAHLPAAVAETTTSVTATNGDTVQDGDAPPERQEAPRIVLTETERAALRVEGIPPIEAIEPVEGEGEPEWEVDSSPYESSTDSDSSDDTSDDSDEDDEDADGDYAMLDPEEAARILMQGDAGSDDEGDKSKSKGEGSGLRTANEQLEDIPLVPDITITEDMKVEELGSVEAIVENNVLIRGKVSGEYQVLESGSLLCLHSRAVAGVVAETLGRVEEPLYTVRFRNVQDIKDRGLSERGTVIYYVPQHSSFVFTQPLKAYKGSDASNFHDEEVGDEEVEFSDDEAEAEHKRQLKLKRQGRSGDAGRSRGSSRGGRGGQRGGYKPSPLSTDINGAAYGNGSLEMNYDDVEEGEEGYTPLARPNNLHEMMNSSQSTEGSSASHMPPPPFVDRGRGRGRHRGARTQDRGGRGGRGNPRGNHNHNHNNRGGSFQGQGYQSQPQPPNLFSVPFQQGQYQYSQSPPAPSLTPQNPTYPYSVATSPMSPLPKSNFSFSGGFQAPQSYNPSFHQQQHPQPQWGQQIPAGFAPQFNNAAMMHFAQQFQQGQQQQQQNGGWQVNQAAAAEVQRQLEEMRRAQGGGQ